MSGIVRSRFNIRGSGVVGSLGTDGQVFTSSGAGVGAVFESAAGGGKVLQVVENLVTGETTHSSDSYTASPVLGAITPSANSSKILVIKNYRVQAYKNGTTGLSNRLAVFRDIAGAGYSHIYPIDANIHHGYGDSEGSRERTMNALQTMTFLDEPNTTSACNYKLYARRDTSGGTNCYVGGSSQQLATIMIEIDGS